MVKVREIRRVPGRPFVLLRFISWAYSAFAFIAFVSWGRTMQVYIEQRNAFQDDGIENVTRELAMTLSDTYIQISTLVHFGVIIGSITIGELIKVWLDTERNTRFR